MTFKKLLFFLILFSLASSLNYSCKNEKKPKGKDTPPKKEAVKVPKFERDSAFVYVKKQVDFGPRVPNTKAHQDCKNWLSGKLENFGAHVIEQDFDAKAYTGTILKGTNIIGQFNPKHKKRILLAAHWDSRHIADSDLSIERRDEPILGADDGGSGVGVLLEVARNLQANPVDIGVDIIFFDAEDHGEEQSASPRSQVEERKSMETWCLGSQYWSRNPHQSSYRPKYGILLDMVGSRNARFPKEAFSMQINAPLVNKIWKLAQSMGYGNYFVSENGGAVTDDHFFVSSIAKIPMIDIINLSPKEDQSFGDYWHTHNDNIDVIDRRTLRSVGQVMLAVIYREAGGTF